MDQNGTSRDHRQYDAVFFDLDGVLLGGAGTDPQLYRDAAAETLDRLGHSVRDGDLDRLGDPGDVDSVVEICRRRGIDVDLFWELREEITSELENDRIREGRRGLYDDADVLSDVADDHQLGIISTNRERTVRFVLSHFGLQELFDVAYGRDRTVDGFRHTKPDPHYLRRAARLLDADDVIYVGDRTSDVVAARNADFDSGFLRRSHNESVDPSPAPTYEFEGLYDLKDAL